MKNLSAVFFFAFSTMLSAKELPVRFSFSAGTNLTHIDHSYRHYIGHGATVNESYWSARPRPGICAGFYLVPGKQPKVIKFRTGLLFSLHTVSVAHDYSFDYEPILRDEHFLYHAENQPFHIYSIELPLEILIYPLRNNDFRLIAGMHYRSNKFSPLHYDVTSVSNNDTSYFSNSSQIEMIVLPALVTGIGKSFATGKFHTGIELLCGYNFLNPDISFSNLPNWIELKFSIELRNEASETVSNTR